MSRNTGTSSATEADPAPRSARRRPPTGGRRRRGSRAACRRSAARPLGFARGRRRVRPPRREPERAIRGELRPARATTHAAADGRLPHGPARQTPLARATGGEDPLGSRPVGGRETLAEGAQMRGALAQDDPADRTPAACAGLPLALVDVEPLCIDPSPRAPCSRRSSCRASRPPRVERPQVEPSSGRVDCPEDGASPARACPRCCPPQRRTTDPRAATSGARDGPDPRAEGAERKAGSRGLDRSARAPSSSVSRSPTSLRVYGPTRPNFRRPGIGPRARRRGRGRGHGDPRGPTARRTAGPSSSGGR
jgi:hypothetical protein